MRTVGLAAVVAFTVASGAPEPPAKHGFTNPKAEEHGMEGLGYDANADKQSWQEMLNLFKEVFG